MSSPHRQRGGVRMLLLVLGVLALGIGGAWWWFLGRYALPEQAPERTETPKAVLDYVGRRDLGLDPMAEMVAPDEAQARKAGVDAKVYYARWQVAYLSARGARGQWQAASAVGAVLDARAGREHAEQARLEYLHQAQTAEYWRARYAEAGGR